MLEAPNRRYWKAAGDVIERHRPTMLTEVDDRTMRTWRHGWRRAGSVEPGVRNYLFRPLAAGRPGNG